MPRIEPYQLLKCLSVLLAPSGGIRSSEVVHRIVSLMTKFSKKLVSKCIYILILKSTEVDLLDMFMSAGGWDLTFSWLSDGIQAKNWPLVVELVELLLICPVDIERLKGNNCPKVIKLLSKDITATENVRTLAGKVVEQWLAIVKGACEASSGSSTQEKQEEDVDQEDVVVENGEIENGVEEMSEDLEDGAQLPVYKITIRDGKQVLAEVISSDRTAQPRIDSVKPPPSDVKVPAQEPDQVPTSVSTNPAGRTSVRLAMNNAAAPESQDVVTNRTLSDRLSSESESEDEVKPVQVGRKRSTVAAAKKEALKKRATKRPSPSHDPDYVVGTNKLTAKKKQVSEKKLKLDPKKEKREEKSKSKDPPASSLLSSKNKLKDEQAERDKNTLAKLITPPISNLGKIPKKVKDDDDKKTEKKPVEPAKPPPKDPKKYNISVETRKSSGDRPKTVKTYNSKFRSTGLEEAPPLPKSVKKSEKKEDEERKPLKRSSPPKESSPVAEKKPKEEEKKVEKAVTPPKSKIMFLQESDVFADALTAANPVKDVKKKKRRTSLTSNSESKKDSVQPPKSEEKKSASLQEPIKPALKFYQDTLVTSEDKNADEVEKACEVKVKSEIKQEAEESPDSTDVFVDQMTRKMSGDKICPSSPVSKEELEDEVAKAEEAINQVLMMEDKKNVEREKNRLPKGILVYVKKRKTIKKNVLWKPEKELESTRYFELDETERVNVTKPFMDMKQMERHNEREHIMLSRKLAADDIMEEKTTWRSLIPIDISGDQVISGKNSLEKEIQYARERTTLQAIYFNRRMIPDSPSEPDLEIHAFTEPVAIPMEDMTGNAESVMSYKNRPWPEPKGYPPGTTEAAAVESEIPPPMQQVMQPGPPGAPPMMQFPPGPPAAPMMGPQGPYPPGPYPTGPFPGHPNPMVPGPEWMGDGNMMGGEMMMGGGEMMMGGDMMMGGMGPGPGPGPGGMGGPGMMGPPGEMYPMGPGPGPGPHPEFMGPPFMGPPHPPFMGPPGPFPPGPPGPGQPHDMHRPPRPWFRQNAGNWRHPSKGGNWNHKGRGMCNNVLKKGFCRINKCPFRHPPAVGNQR